MTPDTQAELEKHVSEACASIGRLVELMKVADAPETHPEAWDLVWSAWADLEQVRFDEEPESLKPGSRDG